MKRRIRYPLLGLFLINAAFPLPASAETTGSVFVSCEAGARLYVDGRFVGVTSPVDGGFRIFGVTPGTHRLDAVRRGFHPKAVPFHVPPGRTVAVLVSGPWEPKAPAVSKPVLPLAPPSPRGGEGRFAVGSDLPSKPRPRPIRKLFNIGFPVVAKVAQPWSNAYTGAALELAFPVHRKISIGGTLFNGYQKFDDLGDSWLALDVGPAFAFGAPRAKIRLRPGLVLSRIAGRHESVEFDSTAFGFSLRGGPEFRFSSHVGLGFFAGIHYFLVPHEGEEEYWAWNPGSSMEYATRSVESRYSVFGGAYLRIAW